MACKWEVGSDLNAYEWSPKPIHPSIRELLAFTIPGRGQYTWRFTPKEKNRFLEYLTYNPSQYESTIYPSAKKTVSDRILGHAKQLGEQYSDQDLAYRMNDIVVGRVTVDSSYYNAHSSNFRSNMSEIVQTEGVALSAEPQSQKLLHKDIANSRRVTFRASDLNKGVELDDLIVETTQVSEAPRIISFNHLQPDLKSFENKKLEAAAKLPVSENAPKNAEPQKEAQPKSQTQTTVPPSDSKLFRKIEFILGEWFREYDVQDVVNGVKILGTDKFNDRLVGSLLTDSMSSLSPKTAVIRTAKLLVELLRDGEKLQISLKTFMLGVVEFAESCQDVFSHIATIYGVLMAHDDATFGFAVLRDLLGDLIETGYRGVPRGSQLLGQVLTVVRMCNRDVLIQDLMARQNMDVSEFWPSKERGDITLIDDWKEEHFL
ncbi:hypothetical protein HDU79_003978 [Rhizoclosmatium sp. JEL0117]|nr:hypothetical protein HDU79_003978 [Rhizoclosmatium sp. JEL0117]